MRYFKYLFQSSGSKSWKVLVKVLENPLVQFFIGSIIFIIVIIILINGVLWFFDASGKLISQTIMMPHSSVASNNISSNAPSNVLELILGSPILSLLMITLTMVMTFKIVGIVGGRDFGGIAM